MKREGWQPYFFHWWEIPLGLMFGAALRALGEAVRVYGLRGLIRDLRGLSLNTGDVPGRIVALAALFGVLLKIIKTAIGDWHKGKQGEWRREKDPATFVVRRFGWLIMPAFIVLGYWLSAKPARP